MIRVSILALVLLAVAPVANAQVTTRVSVSSAGAQGNENSAFEFKPSISADGRFVAFNSWASNLVDGDTNNDSDIFVHDRQSAATSRVSVSSTGAQGTGTSYYPSISADGRYVAFASTASNLVAGDTNGGTLDVFVHDSQNGATSRVSLSSAGVQSNSSSYYPSISAAGRYVAFRSYASNLISGDTNNVWDIFVHDRQTGETERVSVASAGAQGNASSNFCSISADGRYVAFESLASNLVFGDTNNGSDIFVHDRQNGATIRVSVSGAGAQSDDQSEFPSISADGRFVAFNSLASNLVDGDTDGFADVFVHDLLSGATNHVSVSSAGVQGDSGTAYPSISADARYVAFASNASNLVAGDTNGTTDIFVHDRQSGATIRVSVSSAGAEGDEYSRYSSISADGRCIAFESFASNLVDGDTNISHDVFVHDRGLQSSTAYCTAGTSTHGCTPAMFAVGVPSSTQGTGFDLACWGVEGQRYGLIFYGVGPANAVWAINSTSYVCVAPPQQRTGVQDSGGTAGACDGTLSLDFNAYMASHPAAAGSPFSAGDTFYAQVWFRDPGAPKQTNLSNGLMFTLWD